MKAKNVTTTALLAVILALMGMFKIPGIIPGTEFQLSAPFAICIAGVFGFGSYFKIGILASAINLLLGTHTVLNVLIAMVFRIVAGGTIAIFKDKPIFLVISGPLGTTVGRYVLALFLQVSPLPLIAGAVPGMIFTAVTTLLMYPILKKTCHQFLPEMVRE